MRPTFIAVNTRLADFIHCWPDAPEAVGFLRNLHRHELHISLAIEVKHTDRDLEFFMIKRQLDAFLKNDQGNWVPQTSCEMICNTIIDKFTAMYPGRLMNVSVFEDGEVGSTVHFMG